jgi:hypothetical protein
MSRARVGAGKSRCWVCGRQLQRAPGKGKGLFYYLLVWDKNVGTHRIHADCLDQAKQDGLELVLGEEPCPA